MSDETRRMLDTENAAKDRYDLCKKILVALNEENIEKVKSIIKEDMRIYEDEYLYIPNDSDGDIVIELPNRRQTN